MKGSQKGYLNEPYRLFHLKDDKAETFEYHYHEFDKLIFFCSGEVTYLAEGNCYSLQPGDLLLMPRHHIHQPVIAPEQPYERYVLWLNRDFLAQNGLENCFAWVKTSGCHLLSQITGQWNSWMRLLQGMESAAEENAFAAPLLAQTYCLQLLISVNRACLTPNAAAAKSIRSDEKIQEVMGYINSHLEENLSVETLSKRFYLSRSYLMHRFRGAAGCTIHQYISQKRLICAAEALQSGTPVLKAASQSGFQDYSAFLRAFQKAYHTSPRDWKESNCTVKGNL